MTHRDKRNLDARPHEQGGDGKPDTALDEVLHEAEEAETRVTDPEKRHRRGEAGDAITPNVQAQKRSHHD